MTEPTSTPLMFAALGYLRTGDWEVDSGAFILVSLATLVLALLWLGRRVGLGSGQALLLVAIVVATSEPLYSDLAWGNVNCLQVAMLVGYLALRSGRETPVRAVAAGALIGLAVLLKPNLGLVVVLLAVELVISRRWHDAALQLGGVAVSGAAALGITVLRFGSVEPWTAYLGYMSAYALPNAIPGFSVPAGLLQALGYDPIPAERISQVVAILLGSLIVAAVAALVRGRLPGGPGFLSAPRATGRGAARASTSRRSEAPAATGAGVDDRRWLVEATVVGVAVGITLLASPFVENHHFLLVVPLAVVLLRPGRDFGGTRWVGLRQAAAALALFLFSAAPAMVLAAQRDGIPYLACLATGTLVLVVTAIGDLWADPLPAPALRSEPASAQPASAA